ncbi:hypothetical protein FN846DRAFT_891644 [Sphaerosporella brunnea]|uniref:Uncharacterized protein n=1 Tax=Sphaerosporella brunnea TaxID=1250544 RepID=A0A5J5ETT8_9PEZI|nr:hypothetical protein FN846DRAFT_891644 [Sphaerosporella brunnea]
MRSDPALQAALNTYSVAVQRYKMLSALLHRPIRPPVLERFQHLQNRCAVERRTAHVEPIAPHDGLVKQIVAATPAEEKLYTTGRLRQPLRWTRQDGIQGPRRAGFIRCLQSQHEVLRRGLPKDGAAPVVDNSLPDLALLCSDWDLNDHMPHDSIEILSTAPDSVEDAFSPAEEIDAVVRVGVVSPDAAIRMARVVDRLKVDGTSPATLKKGGGPSPDMDGGAMRGDYD